MYCPKGLRFELLSLEAIPFYNADLDLPAVPERPAPVVRTA